MMNSRRTFQFLVWFTAISSSLVWLYPFFLVFVNSIKTRSEIFTNTLFFPENGTTENYPVAFEDLNFFESFSNSLLITGASLVIIVLFTSMAAYALNRNKRKTSSVIYFFCAITMLIPFQSVMIPLVRIFGNVNMLNRVGLIFMNLGFASSMAIILYFGALRSIPRSLDEAALIDGATPFQIFRHIIFPMLMPTTVTVIILNAIRIWNDYLLPSLVINRAGSYTIPLQMYYFFGEYTTQWHLALAGLVLAMIPIILLFIFLQKYIIKGVADGAVK